MQYATIQYVIAFIKKSPCTIVLGKVDTVGIPNHSCVTTRQAFVGSSVERKFYMDTILPMGLVSSYNIFESFSSALEWMAKTTLGLTWMVH